MPGLGSDVFYSNDAVVLLDVLVRQVEDAPPSPVPLRGKASARRREGWLKRRTLELAVAVGALGDGGLGVERAGDKERLAAALRAQEDLPEADRILLQRLQTS